MSSSLSTSRLRRTSLLCLLYFSQGFPWGFATIALLALLSEAGHDKAQTATIVAMAVLPWSFKLVWGPVIDSLRLPALGTRRPWIVFAQSMMALTLLGAATNGALASSDTLVFFAWVFFVHNCFASLQDVATDALAVDLLDDDERGRVNGMMWASKLLGIGVGGAGMAYVVAQAGLRTAVVLQAIGVLAIMALVIAWRERPTDRLWPWSTGMARREPPAALQAGLWTALKELRRALSTRTTATLLLISVLVHVPEGLYDPLATQVFVQELGWSAQHYAAATGTWGVLAELAGALLGGFLCDRLGRERMASVGLLLSGGVLLTYGLTAAGWPSTAYPHLLLIPAFKGTIAFMTVCMLSLFMHACWTRAAATQFTLYMAVSNVGYAIGAQLNAWPQQLGFSLDIAGSFVLGGTLALLPIALFLAVHPDSIAVRRRAEQRALAAA